MTEIQKQAFANQTIITDFIIPDGVTKIGELAFSNCGGLNRLVIPDGVTSIAQDSFSRCENIRNLTVPVNYIGFISKGNLETVTLTGNGAIEAYAFRGYVNLVSVTIGNNVTAIGDSAFYGCTGLTDVTIGNGVTIIGTWAFNECIGLTSMTVGNGVTTLGYGAFDECTSLSNVIIPNSVTTIGGYAFFGCTSLKKVYYGGTENQWKQISIDNIYCYNAQLLNAPVIITAKPSPLLPATSGTMLTEHLPSGKLGNYNETARK